MRPLPFVVMGSVLLCSAQSATAQIVWNPTTDFSTINGNPNGVWTYGWMNTAFTTFTPYASSTANSWRGNIGGDGTPVIWLNTSGSTSYGVPNGNLSIHPGPGTEPSILRWTAPTGTSGTAHVVGQFLAGDSGTMLVAVRFNGGTVWSATDAGAFDFNQLFVAGDQMDFAVYGGYSYGNTPLVMSITAAIPEPAFFSILAGSLALGLAYKRRRRSALAPATLTTASLQPEPSRPSSRGDCAHFAASPGRSFCGRSRKRVGLPFLKSSNHRRS